MSLRQLSMLEAFKVRRSIRTYKPTFSDDRHTSVKDIVRECNKLQSPLGHFAELDTTGPGAGWAGFVKDEAGWIIGKVDKAQEKNPQAIFDAAFKLQVAVMKLTQEKIGTVWIAGSFKQSKLENDFKDIAVPMCTPFGDPGNDDRAFVNFLRWSSGANKRKPIQKMFFDVETNKPITKETAGERLDLIETVRFGPSANNGQPWRVLFTKDSIHLYNAGWLWCTPMDIGIAAANIMLHMKENNKEVDIHLEPHPLESPIGGKYFCSITPK